MATQFRRPFGGPDHISSEPQKSAPPEKTAGSGLEHRPFTDDEIKQAFDTFDLDKNRFVGAAEISQILQIIGEEVTDEEIDEMIRICDTDGDGQVTFDEFYKMMTQPPPPIPPPLPEVALAKKRGREAKSTMYRKQATSERLGEGGTQKPMSVKKQLEKEKREKARAAEFRATSVEALVKKLSGGMGKIKPSQIKKVYKRFQDIDVDGSGAIEYEEFIQALDMENGNVSRQMFRVFDMDGSGSIELKEFIVMLSRYTTAAKSEKLRFAFMMFDEDGSGFIERGELTEMLRSSFIVEGLTPEELDDKCDQVYDFLKMPRDGAISYEQFGTLANSRRGLIYPVEEVRHDLATTQGQDMSINALFQEAQANEEAENAAAADN